MKRTHWKTLLASMLAGTMACSLTACGVLGNSSALDPKNPTTVTVWNYYNGEQLLAFEHSVEEFNATVGLEEGIIILSESHGNLGQLADNLLDSVAGEIGAADVPDLAAIYAETAYILEEQHALMDMDKYFSKEELSKYIPNFIEEGRFNAENALLLFPICKSSELFSVNATDWKPFAKATGTALAEVKTNEDLTRAAEAYYNWTDAQTPDIPEDGKALYGRDSLANYLYIGSYQLGHEMFSVKDGKLTVDMDRDTFKTLWDNYYIPYINGYFGAYGNYRSDDTKTGKIIALTSSTTGMSYMPTQVTTEDNSTYDIEVVSSAPLPFADAENNTMVQQGASFCLLKSDEARQEGAVAFLKWFTDTERNLDFSVQSGYSPVTIEANQIETIKAHYDNKSAKDTMVLDALCISTEAFSKGNSYATKPFAGSKDIRSALEDAINNVCTRDREEVCSSIMSGMTRAQAVAPFVTDAYFDAWFSQLQETVSAFLQE